MKTKNKIGPSTDPCGTPEVTVTWEDFSLSKTTVCDYGGIIDKICSQQLTFKHFMFR